MLLAGVAASAAGKPAGAAAAGGRISILARPAPLDIDPRRTALLVIDMQNDFGARGGMFDRAGIDIRVIQAVVPAVRSVIADARRGAIPIVYLKMGYRPDLGDAGPAEGPNRAKQALLHVGEPNLAPDGSASRILIRDTWDTDILPDLRPSPEDLVLYKTRYSGFVNTGLDAQLRARGIDSLIVTGCTTSICVESTVRDAFYRDYRCLVLEDCVAEPIAAHEARTNHQASLLAMQVNFAWISDAEKFRSALPR